jgi:hypothetical protein
MCVNDRRRVADHFRSNQARPYWALDSITAGAKVENFFVGGICIEMSRDVYARDVALALGRAGQGNRRLRLVREGGRRLGRAIRPAGMGVDPPHAVGGPRPDSSSFRLIGLKIAPVPCLFHLCRVVNVMDPHICPLKHQVAPPSHSPNLLLAVHEYPSVWPTIRNDVV